MFLEELIQNLIPIVIHLLEAMGTFVIIFSATKAFFIYVKGTFKGDSSVNTSIKINLANGLALALEFKLGSEILKTVIIRSLEEMYILAAIIGLRALLTFVIHWEIKSETHCNNDNMDANISNSSIKTNNIN